MFNYKPPENGENKNLQHADILADIRTAVNNLYQEYKKHYCLRLTTREGREELLLFMSTGAAGMLMGEFVEYLSDGSDESSAQLTESPSVDASGEISYKPLLDELNELDKEFFEAFREEYKSKMPGEYSRYYLAKILTIAALILSMREHFDLLVNLTDDGWVPVMEKIYRIKNAVTMASKNTEKREGPTGRGDLTGEALSGVGGSGNDTNDADDDYDKDYHYE